MGSKDFTMFLILLSFHLSFTRPSTAMHPLCHEEESSALSQFKRSFSINCAASPDDPLAYPKTASWNASNRGEGGGECEYCSWDGVECDPHTGHVIGLDLGSSCLYGSINSSNSLFHLVHLRRLDLGNNDFNGSQVPSGLGRLSRLTHLNLSHSSFSGQIPQQVLELSQLVSLALWGNPLTMLQKPGLESLVQNLTTLQELHLSQVSISSTVPVILANLSNLTSLYLKDCGLHGEFPRGVFHLPKLRSLSLCSNPTLTGLLPEFSEGSPLQSLELASTGFYGKLPNSIGNLNSLNGLNVSNCSLSGTIPASMANLTQLRFIGLSDNYFDSQAWPSWLGKLSQLSRLGLRNANLKGEVSYSLANLTHLSYLSLGSNQLRGGLSYWLPNLTRLILLDISDNNFQGSIPDSVSQLSLLESLILYSNNLSGTVEMNMFMKLKNLTEIHLSYNKLSVITKTNISDNAFKRWYAVGLASCNLSKFPNFLNGQNELSWLNLERNTLHGPIPKWFWNSSTESLEYLNLRSNSLTKFEHQPVLLPWKRMEWISLESNRMQGFLPIPRPSIIDYEVANNSFNGNLPQQLCSLTSLHVLDVSNNNLSGTIPPCFGSSGNNLNYLDLKGNNFHGTLPQKFGSGSQLRSIDLSQNRLQGRLPRSLAECAMLELLDISNNEINDDLPYWLGNLLHLKVLILRSNRFHGIVRGVGNAESFPELQVIDLSHNGFFGNLPEGFIQNWKAMKASNSVRSTYLRTSFFVPVFGHIYAVAFTTKLLIKGVELKYSKLLDKFMVIDLSSNRFDGLIPKSIGDLKGLHSLNLSNNCFKGPILSSLGNLSKLESLDLSYNKLSGQIPMELVQLTFLGQLNLSYNNLSGAIPHGKQFDTFPNTSYLGNMGLCGNPLSKQCGNSNTSIPAPTTPEKDIDVESLFEFDWLVISMGYSGGLVVGLVIGCSITATKHEWFVDTFGRKPQKHRKRS